MAKFVIQTGPVGTTFPHRLTTGRVNVVADMDGNPLVFESEEDAAEFILDNCPSGWDTYITEVPSYETPDPCHGPRRRYNGAGRR